jgi:hypothetical protein
VKIFTWWTGRRRRRYGLAATAAAALSGSVLVAVPAFSDQPPAFDLDHGNALVQIIFPRYDQIIRTQSVGRQLLVLDRAMQIEVPLFDAISPYEPAAVGIFSDLGRRPEAERTVRNVNIAVLYSAFTSLNAALPEYQPMWLEMMQAAGVDPTVTAEDPTTPSGIGILAAKNALRALKHDGTNREGDEGGRAYNRQPYADYTGYQPVNTAYQLRNPSRWQPNVITQSNPAGQTVFTVQQFAVPQYGRLTPFSYASPTQFTVPPPVSSNVHNFAAYRRQADQVLAASANLNDTRKMTAEFFNDTVPSYGAVARKVNIDGRYTTAQTVKYITAADLVFHDTSIASYYFVRKYDSIRPFSAIRYLYGNRKVTAWGGPAKGTVDDISGKEWQAYLYRQADADYPEYPSVGAAACLAFSEQLRRNLGTDQIDLSFAYAKGSSSVEPGVTPATDITLHWNTLTDFADDCGQSGVWGGENFPAAVQAAAQYAPRIGDLVYEFLQNKLNGH